MAYIVDFEIHGLAGRTESVSFKLNQDVNVFYGLNGRGKTSMLRILESAMSRDGSGLGVIPFDSAEVRIYSLAYDQIFTHIVENRRRGTTSSLSDRDATMDMFPSRLKKPIQKARRRLLDGSATFTLTANAVTVNENLEWKVEPGMSQN